jgi:hypothetical protein
MLMGENPWYLMENSTPRLCWEIPAINRKILMPGKTFLNPSWSGELQTPFLEVTEDNTLLRFSRATGPSATTPNGMIIETKQKKALLPYIYEGFTSCLPRLTNKVVICLLTCLPYFIT